MKKTIITIISTALITFVFTSAVYKAINREYNHKIQIAIRGCQTDSECEYCGELCEVPNYGSNIGA